MKRLFLPLLVTLFTIHSQAQSPMDIEQLYGAPGGGYIIFTDWGADYPLPGIQEYHKWSDLHLVDTFAIYSDSVCLSLFMDSVAMNCIQIPGIEGVCLDTFFVNEGDSLVLVECDNDTTFFACGCDGGGDADWWELGDTPPDAITDEMYHLGDVHIGDATMSANGALNVVGKANINRGTNNAFIQGGNNTQTGTGNAALGALALNALTDGDSNIGIGVSALEDITSGDQNVAIGVSAGSSLTTAFQNTIVGNWAGLNTTGSYNTFLGDETGRKVSGGSSNTMIGTEAGSNGTAGNYSNNTFLGYTAGRDVAGSGNLFLGYRAGRGETGSNKLYIANSHDDELIRGDFTADSVHIKGSLRLRDEFIDATNSPGTSGQVLSSTVSGTDWIDLVADGDGNSSNELQTLSTTSDATSNTTTLSNSGGSLKLIEGTGITLTTGVTGLNGEVTIATTALLAEVDGDPTNELQELQNTSDATSHTVTLTTAAGSLQLVEGANITLTTTGDADNGIVTIASTGGGGGSMDDFQVVGADTGGPGETISDGETVTFDGGAGTTVTQSGATILITEGDASTTNEIQTLDVSGTGPTVTLDLSSDGSDPTITGSGAAAVTATGNAITVGVSQEAVQDYVGTMLTGNTETGITVTYDDAGNMIDFVVTDASATNELQTLNSTSTGTSHTVTLSNSGGSIVLNQGVGINFLNHTNGLNGAVEIEAADASEVNEIQTLSASGSGTTYAIDLSLSGGSVGLIEGTGVTIDRSGNNLTINSSGGSSDSDWLEEGLGTPPNSINDHMYTGTGDHGFGTTTPDRQIDIAASAATGPSFQMDYTTGTDVGGIMGTMSFAYANSDLIKIQAAKQTSNSNNDADFVIQLKDNGGAFVDGLELDYETGTVVDKPRLKTFGGHQNQNWVNVSSNTQLDEGHYGVRVTASSVTITLPLVTITNTEGIGTEVIIYNQSAGSITIDPGTGSDSLNGSTSNMTLTTKESKKFICTYIDGSNVADWISID